jgi:drug/metabolite transporter (DMT)-like permease
MIYLFVTSVLWGLSFGLIKAEVSSLNPIVVSFIRLGFAFVLFIPWLKKTAPKNAVRLMAIGFIQFGLMYCLYIWAYQYLKGHEIAILTITTPLFVVLIDAIGQQSIRWRDWFAAALALAGGAALLWQKADGKELSLALRGVFLIQTANLCFAAGQVLYKRRQSGAHAQADHKNFAWLYLGAILAPASYLAASTVFEPGSTLFDLRFPHTLRQWLALIYLGLIPSGLGFFLWNKGSTRVSYGRLAVMNNFKIPAAVLIAWLVFSESVEWVAALSSLLLLGIGNLVASQTVPDDGGAA